MPRLAGQSENTVVQFFRDKHDEYGLFCRLLSFALNQGSGSGAAELCLTSAWSDRQGAKPEDIQPHTSTASEMPNKRQTELVRHLRSRFDKFAIPVRKFRVRRTLHMRLSRVWQLRSHHYICSQPYFRIDPVIVAGLGLEFIFLSRLHSAEVAVVDFAKFLFCFFHSGIRLV